jgi:hypothetical protein
MPSRLPSTYSHDPAPSLAPLPQAKKNENGLQYNTVTREKQFSMLKCMLLDEFFAVAGQSNKTVVLPDRKVVMRIF